MSKETKENEIFGLKGTFIYSVSQNELKIQVGTAICKNGICQGIFEQLPEQYQDILVYNYSDKIIIPGMVDLHIHAPQYQFRTIGMDMELLDWLNTYTFPEESRYADHEYAQKAYQLFVDDLQKGATTRAVIFGTMHKDATMLLMDKLEKSGLITMAGLVNMDRNCPEYLCDENAETSIEKTIAYVEEARNKYQNTYPVLTPRFIPTCSDEVMKGLSTLKQIYHLALQSHLSENLSEIDWVAQLCPKSESYTDAYDQAGSFDESGKTVMAHCVHLSDKEMELLKRKQVYIAHCPESNINLSSGIAPVRTFLQKNMHVGIGTDVAAGTSANMLQAVRFAIQASKMYWRLCDETKKPLSVEEAFYLATKGGGSFFGRVGSFEAGYEYDAVVLDDSKILSAKELNTKERFERLLYLGDNSNVTEKFVAGRKINCQ